MSKLKIVLILALLTAVVVGLFVWQYFASFHQVSFTVTKGVSVNLYQVVSGKKQNSFKTISDSVVVPLQNGDFCAQTDDTKYNTNAVCFNVKDKDLAVVVEPDYSVAYLAQQLPNQLDKINSVITGKYSGVIGGFTLNPGFLYSHGEWYGATLTQKVARNDQGDVYRVLLNKINDTWTIVAYPQIVLSKYDYPNVPYNILDAVNRQVGAQGL